MSSLPYYKKYAKDFLDGTAGMTGELKGAYSVLLDLIYIQSGKLPDDPHYISGNLGYSVRKWNSIKSELINRGKIEVNNGIISNKRADKEQIILSKYQDNQAEKASKSNKNNKLAKAAAGTDYINTETETDTTLLGASALIDQSKIDLMLNALNITDENKSIGLLQWSEPIRWVEQGCDFEKDILPTLRQIGARGKVVTSWAYCSKAVFEAKAKREAPAPSNLSVVSTSGAHPRFETPAQKMQREIRERQEANAGTR